MCTLLTPYSVLLVLYSGTAPTLRITPYGVLPFQLRYELPCSLPYRAINRGRSSPARRLPEHGPPHFPYLSKLVCEKNIFPPSISHSPHQLTQTSSFTIPNLARATTMHRFAEPESGKGLRSRALSGSTELGFANNGGSDLGHRSCTPSEAI